MISDLRLALRQLAKSPGFTVVAVLITAIGIAAATSIFSTVNAVLLRPPALPAPDRLAAVYETNLPRDVQWFSCSYVNYADWRERSRSFESLAAVGGVPLTITGGKDPEFVYGVTLTANFLPTLGVKPALGRGFLEEEDKPGNNRVAIISNDFWRHRFGGAPDVLDRKLILNGASYSIVGVLGADAFMPVDMEIAVPMGADLSKEDRLNHEIGVFGRLKQGVTLEQADAELKAVAAQVWDEHPDLERGWSTRMQPLMVDLFSSETRVALYTLLGAVGLLLLLTCANLSNLLLVRTTTRSHEIAIRTALGAGRGRIIRQIVTESLTVAVMGGLLGVLASEWAVDFLRSLPLTRAREIALHPAVLAVALGMTLLTGLLTGLGPALRASQSRPQEALKSRSSRGGQRSRLRDALVVVQLAISLVLLVGATLLGRSFVRLLRVDPGFNADNAITFSLRPAGGDEAVMQFYTRLTERLRGMPGISAVGVISSLPLTEGNTSLNVFPKGESLVPTGESIQAGWRLVDGGYFKAMQIPVVRGTSFEGMKPDEARRSVVISAQLAKQLWGDADPVGRQLDPGGNGRFLTVAGVVGDVRSEKLGIAPAPAFYWSMYRFIYGPMHLVVRLAAPKPGEGGTTADATAIAPQVRAIVKEIDPNVPVFRVRTLEALRATSLEQQKLVLSLLGGFTTVALFLAALGTYGILAFNVQQRTHEIGVRIAIGAQSGDIIRLILGHGMQLVLGGSVLGLAGALAVTRLITSVLYQTDTDDLASYFAAFGLLAFAALVACWLPARRATKVDPTTALRTD